MRVKIWTDEQEQFIIDHYGRLSDIEIADHIGKDPNKVRSKAHHMRKMGKAVARRTSDKLKDPENMTSLLDSYGSIPTHKLAKRYKVSLSAIYRAVKKNRVRFAANDGRYTFSELASVLKIDAKTIKGWTHRGLKISAYAKDGLTKPRSNRRLGRSESTPAPFHALISTRDLRNFFKFCPEAYDLKRLDGETRYAMGLSRIKMVWKEKQLWCQNCAIHFWTDLYNPRARCPQCGKLVGNQPTDYRV